MDWLAHVGIALLLTFLFKIEKKTFFLIGSILPDLFGKFHYLLKFFYGTKTVHYLSLPASEPIGVLLLCMTIALMFKDSKKVFKLLLIGSVIHLFLDLVIVYETIMPFWPISWVEILGFNVISTQHYYYPLIITYVLIFCYFIVRKAKNFYISQTN